MMNAQIEVQKINYEKSIRNLVERILPILNGKTDVGMAVRLLQKLGESAPAVFCNLIQYMSEEGKARLICELVNQYQEKLTEVVNKALALHELGKNLTLGGMVFQAFGEGLLIYAQNVRVNYSGILNNGAVQKTVEDTVQQYTDNSFLKKIPKLGGLLKDNANAAAKAAAVFAPATVEKKVLQIIESPENKRKMIILLENVLETEGLVLTIGQINIMGISSLSVKNVPAAETGDVADCNSQGQVAEEKHGLTLSEEMEELVLEALSKYLKASVI